MSHGLNTDETRIQGRRNFYPRFICGQVLSTPGKNDRRAEKEFPLIFANRFVWISDYYCSFRPLEKEGPRITPIRADKYERGESPIRAYPRNPRLDLFCLRQT